ncbi:zinc-binding protein A33-like [Engraulis encrasicolus]|uniref:zinc-binding protein A33-like n=1 Tax=Engraulis encrasicolus TaxID=184585 RepID=UPI002FD53E8F
MPREQHATAPVILDPNTAGYISLSDCLTKMEFCDDGPELPENPERFHRSECVLGSEGFNSGTHCWDVVVDLCIGPWSVGLKAESSSRDGPDSNWQGFWGIHYVGYMDDSACEHGKYQARSPGASPIPLKVNQRPRRIRVQLDWDRGELSITDLENNTRLYTFTHAFTERMFPCFMADCCTLRIVSWRIVGKGQDLTWTLCPSSL